MLTRKSEKSVYNIEHPQPRQTMNHYIMMPNLLVVNDSLYYTECKAQVISGAT